MSKKYLNDVDELEGAVCPYGTRDPDQEWPIERYGEDKVAGRTDGRTLGGFYLDPKKPPVRRKKAAEEAALKRRS